MKFGNVGQELLGGSGGQTRQERDAQATLNDFKQSFSKLNVQRHLNQPANQVSAEKSTLFQTSYQS